MRAPVVTTKPVDPMRPQGRWAVWLNGQVHESYADQDTAERHADNLREVLLSYEIADDGGDWLPSATNLVLAVITVILVLALIGHCSQAKAATGGLHLATAHFGNDALRSESPGLYARHSSGATAGFYRNSYARWSAYAGYTWQTPGKALALTAGAVTGYPAHRVMPLLVPSVRLPLTGDTHLRVAYIPKPPDSGTAAGLHAAIEKEF